MCMCICVGVGVYACVIESVSERVNVCVHVFLVFCYHIYNILIPRQ